MGSLDKRDHITINAVQTGDDCLAGDLPESSVINQNDSTDNSDNNTHVDSRTSPTVKKILYSLTALAILGGLYHLWMTPIVIRAPYGQTIITALPDHSIVELNSGTTLKYSRNFGWVNRKVTLNGEAFFSVKGSTLPFEVETFNSILESIGTKFNVRSWNSDPGKKTVVTLIDGELDFASKANPKNMVMVLSGQTSSVSGLNPVPSQPRPANVMHVVSWRENGLSFEAQPLSVIFREMERRYNIMIKTTNSRILEDSLTIYIAKPTGPKEVLSNICQADNLKYDTTVGGYIVSSN